MQEEISERDVDDSFRSMFAQLSGDVSQSVRDESVTQEKPLCSKFKLKL